MQKKLTKPYVCVIGGLNIDLQGSSDKPLVFNDSNPGEVAMSAGGVGRNIAENISKLNIHSKILSYAGNDALGDYVIDQSRASKVDTSLVIKHSRSHNKLHSKFDRASSKSSQDKSTHWT